MSPPPPNQVSVRYYLRRTGGAPSGPHEGTAIAAMLADGTLDGSEEISADRKAWKSVRALSPDGAAAPRKRPVLAQLRPNAAATAPRGAPLDFDDEDGISLAPLELGFAKDDEQRPGGNDGGRGRAEAKAEPGTGSLSRGDEDSSGGGGEVPSTGPEGIDLGTPLELVERKPSRGAKPAPPSPTGAGTPGAGTDPPRPPPGGGAIAAPVGSEASAAVASLMDEEGHEPPLEATQPVQLDEKPAAGEARTRPRTMTAARGGPAPPGGRWARRPSKRALVIAASLLLLGAAGAAVWVLDLPGRLRGEISPVAVLGPLAAEIARDRFPAYAEAARRLDEAVAGQRGGASARAAAAELLASSVVIHGGERGRIARAQVLLDADEAGVRGGPAEVARARAQAWIALAKGRWKDATRIAAAPAIAAADRAALAGWAALGLEDAGGAATAFAVAVSAQPPPGPSRVAALYGAAHAREAELSPAAEAAYHAVLAQAPAHVGAALGLVRLSKSSPSGRLALAEAVIAKQAPDASRAELAEAHALVARAARELGDGPKAEAALKRAREADPAGVAAAVAAGDALLAEGRTDEAVGQFKAALSPPVSAPRTPSLQFARVAALLESARPAEALVALAALERRLPSDARAPFWRGWAAERERPANLAAADRAYREAVTRDPRFLPASLQLARLLLDQRRGADALGVLRNAETQGVPVTPLRIALGQAQLASRNADEAARTFRQLRAGDAKNPAARLGLASALELQGNLEGARAELTALGARKDVPGLQSRVAAILAKLGRRDEALATYQREITSGAATATTKVAAARVAIELGRKDVARALAQAAVEDDPRTPGALLALADVWRLDGDLPRAILELRRALAVDGAAEVQLEYGRALAAIGRDEEALAALAQARDIPESGVERGRILLRRGDAEGAAKELAAAAERLPSHAEAQLLLGQAEDRLGRAARAESAWRMAVKLAPASAEARYRLGRLEMDRGHAAAALPHLRVAAQQQLPTVGRGAGPAWTTELFFQLGFAEIRHGSRERALTAFRRYLELAPPDAPARAEVTRQMGSRAP